MAHLASGQVSRVVYGSIIGLALVVALEAHPPPTRSIIATLLGTAVAVALAEYYSDMLDAKARRREEHGRTILEHALAAAFGISFPAIFFLLSAAGVMEQDTAFDIAEWTRLGTDRVLRLLRRPPVRRRPARHHCSRRSASP